MKNRCRHSLVLLSSILGASLELNAQDLVLTNAQIVDPATRTVVRGAVWIEGGRIAGQGPAPPPAARGERIDLEGRWLIPGLNDLHTHSRSNAASGVTDAPGSQGMAMRVLRAGVTVFLDLFADEDDILTLRDRQRRGEVGGAEIFAAGPCLTATNGHCSEYGIPTRVIDSPDDARRQVAAVAAKRPDVIKVVYDHTPGARPSIDRPTLEALIRAASERNLRTVVHVGTWDDTRDAVSAGSAAITHVPPGMQVPPYVVVPDDIVTLMVARRTYHIPTVVAHLDAPEFFDHPDLLDSPLAVALTTDAIRAVFKKGLTEGSRGWNTAARARSSSAAVIDSVRRLHKAGVPMLTGSDGGNTGVIQGYSVHRELIRLVQAGLSPWEALAASTTRAGEFLGRRFGVQAGDAANLVVLDGSPLDDIANTQRIAMVIMRGQVVYR